MKLEVFKSCILTALTWVFSNKGVKILTLHLYKCFWCKINEVKWNLIPLTTRSTVSCCRSVGQCGGARVIGLVGINSMCLVQCFHGTFWICLAFGLCLPSPLFPPFIFHRYISDRCLVSLVWGLTAGRRGFTSHGGITLSWRLALPIVEGPGHPGHPAPLSYAVVDWVLKWSFFTFNSFVYLPNVWGQPCHS